MTKVPEKILCHEGGRIPYPMSPGVGIYSGAPVHKHEFAREWCKKYVGLYGYDWVDSQEYNLVEDKYEYVFRFTCPKKALVFKFEWCGDDT